MKKTRIGAVPYVAPIPIVLVGAVVDGRPNFATVGDCAVLGIRPALVAVSLSATHHTTRGVVAHQAFSINVPTESMVEIVDAFGMVSGRDVDKDKILPSEPGLLAGVPLALDCPINLECRVRTTVEVAHRRIFVADVIETHVAEEFVLALGEEPRIAPLTAIRPIVYALDGDYYGVGKKIATSYDVGRSPASRRPE